MVAIPTIPFNIYRIRNTGDIVKSIAFTIPIPKICVFQFYHLHHLNQEVFSTTARGPKPSQDIGFIAILGKIE